MSFDAYGQRMVPSQSFDAYGSTRALYDQRNTPRHSFNMHVPMYRPVHNCRRPNWQDMHDGEFKTLPPHVQDELIGYERAGRESRNRVFHHLPREDQERIATQVAAPVRDGDMCVLSKAEHRDFALLDADERVLMLLDKLNDLQKLVTALRNRHVELEDKLPKIESMATTAHVYFKDISKALDDPMVKK